MEKYKNRHRLWIKIITMVVVCLFSISSISFADMRANTLAPKLAFSDKKSSAEIKAAMICELIEKRATEWEGKNVEQIYLEDMLLWKKSTEPLFEGFEPRLSFDKSEIIISIPGSNMQIRYYDSDPEKTKTLIPFTNWSKTKTQVLEGTLINRQILHRVESLEEKGTGEKEKQSQKYPTLEEIEDYLGVKLEPGSRAFEEARKRIVRLEKPLVVFRYGPLAGMYPSFTTGAGRLPEDQGGIFSNVARNIGIEKSKEYLNKYLDDTDSFEIIIRESASGAIRSQGGDPFISTSTDLETVISGFVNKHLTSYDKNCLAVIEIPAGEFVVDVSDSIEMTMLIPHQIPSGWIKQVFGKKRVIDENASYFSFLKEDGFLNYWPSNIEEQKKLLRDLDLSIDVETQFSSRKNRLFGLSGEPRYMVDGISVAKALEFMPSLYRDVMSNPDKYKIVVGEKTFRINEVDSITINDLKHGEIKFVIDEDRKLEQEQLEKKEMTTEEKRYASLVEKNLDLVTMILRDMGDDMLFRMPIEIIESMDKENTKNFFEAVQYKNSNGYIELFYASGEGDVNEKTHQMYGLRKKPANFRPNKENTITLMPVFKGEISKDKKQARRDIEYIVSTRLGSLQENETQVVPIGYQNDSVGILRGTMFGLVITHVAREKNKGNKLDETLIENQFVQSMLKFYSPEELEKVNLKAQDIINLATGSINVLVPVLRKLIDLLPIEPIDARKIYENTRRVWVAA